MPDGERGSIAAGGTVIEALPNGLFRVRLKDEPRTSVTAHVAGESGLLRLLVGDEVVVELAGYDATRGRIVRRLR